MSTLGLAYRAARFLAAALALLTVVGLSAPRSHAASCPGAGTVTSAGNAFIAAAARNTAAAFSSALARHTDTRSAALFALGQYRKDLPRARQGEFLSGAHAFMARFLLRYSGPFRTQRDLIIESCRGALIETSLGGRSKMVWRLTGGRIRDVRVSGVWLSIQLRSKFTGIIRRNDGKVDALLDFLRSGSN
ncbi:ABC transporter substrate-binding protein [Taklimakanibacter deserti]|uniref:ABC transporter substrate-binding protein n=1 Tax=Taklimakanibacter deserti TaxID=2267839 RepID=UPI000E64CCF2